MKYYFVYNIKTGIITSAALDKEMMIQELKSKIDSDIFEYETNYPDTIIESYNYKNKELIKKTETDKQAALEYNKALQNISVEKQYLSETDWYVVRKMDSGKEIPIDVTQKRKEARIKINESQKVYKNE